METFLLLRVKDPLNLLMEFISNSTEGEILHFEKKTTDYIHMSSSGPVKTALSHAELDSIKT